MTSPKAKILLVDDHTLILQGIKHVVSQMPEIEKVYTASSGAEAMLLIAMQPYNPQIEMFAHFKTKSSFHKTKRII